MIEAIMPAGAQAQGPRAGRLGGAGAGPALPEGADGVSGEAGFVAGGWGWGWGWRQGGAVRVGGGRRLLRMFSLCCVPPFVFPSFPSPARESESERVSEGFVWVGLGREVGVWKGGKERRHVLHCKEMAGEHAFCPILTGIAPEPQQAATGVRESSFCGTARKPENTQTSR